MAVNVNQAAGMDVKLTAGMTGKDLAGQIQYMYAGCICCYNIVTADIFPGCKGEGEEL